MEPIPFSGQLTEDAYHRINALTLRKLKIVVLVFFVVIGGYPLLGNSWDVWLSAGIPMLVVAFFFLFFLRYSVRQQWKKSKFLQKPFSGFVTDEGFTWNIQEVSSTHIAWNMCLHYRETPSLILVYTGLNQAYYFLPDFFAKEGDWDELRKVVKSKLTKK
jgi:hypothetical protein